MRQWSPPAPKPGGSWSKTPTESDQSPIVTGRRSMHKRAGITGTATDGRPGQVARRLLRGDRLDVSVHRIFLRRSQITRLRNAWHSLVRDFLEPRLPCAHLLE